MNLILTIRETYWERIKRFRETSTLEISTWNVPRLEIQLLFFMSPFKVYVVLACWIKHHVNSSDCFLPSSIHIFPQYTIAHSTKSYLLNHTSDSAVALLQNFIVSFCLPVSAWDEEIAGYQGWKRLYVCSTTYFILDYPLKQRHLPNRWKICHL